MSLVDQIIGYNEEPIKPVLRSKTFNVTEKKYQERPKLHRDTINHLIESWETIATISKGMEIPYILVLQPFLHLRETISEKEKNIAQEWTYSGVIGCWIPPLSRSTLFGCVWQEVKIRKIQRGVHFF